MRYIQRTVTYRKQNMKCKDKNLQIIKIRLVPIKKEEQVQIMINSNNFKTMMIYTYNLKEETN